MTFQYLVNQRSYTTFLPLEKELLMPPHQNFYFDLSYLGIIKVMGKNAREFLQGMLTCDVRQVDQKRIAQGAQCQLKGRILTLMDILSLNDENFYLILPCDLLQLTLDSLAKTALLSRVTLEEISPPPLLGLFLQNRKDPLLLNLTLDETPFSITWQNEDWCYHLGHQLYVISPKSTPPIPDLRGSLAWHALNLKRGGFHIYPETRNKFLPQRLGLEGTHYLSFDKGCYKGQEIIARMHYLGSSKHQMRLLTFETSEPFISGQRLLALQTDKEIGEIVDYCPIAQDTYLVAASVLLDFPHAFRIEGKDNPMTWCYFS